MTFRNSRAAPVLGLLATLALACSSEEVSETQREAARAALAKGDRTAALRAIEAIRPGDAAPPERVFEYAELLVRAGEAPQALWVLEGALRRFPGHNDLNLLLAHVALLVGNASLAKQAALRVEPESKQHLEARLTLANAELVLGSPEDALRVFEQAEASHPDRPESRLSRIKMLFEQHRYEDAEQAVRDAQDALAGLPGEREALRERLELARYQLQALRGEPDAAIEGLLTLVERNPGYSLGWQVLTSLWMRTQRAVEGVRVLGAAIEKSPDGVVLYGQAALLHQALGQHAEAVAAMREFCERSNSPSGYVSLARFHGLAGESEAALAALRDGVARFPDSPMLRMFLAEALLSAGSEEALAEIARFESLAPDDPYKEYLAARLSLVRGDPEAARSRLERLMPSLDQAATQFWLAQALERLGDHSGAMRRYLLAIRRDPRDPAAYLSAIRLANEQRDWSTAVAVSERLALGHPRLDSGWLALVGALIQLGESERAARITARLGEVFPENVEIHLIRIRALRHAGRFDEALEASSRLREEQAPIAQIEAEHALTLAAAGREDQAIRSCLDAIGRFEGSAMLHHTLAALAFEAGRVDLGVRSVDRALELAPEDPGPLRTRATFFAATGRLDQALSDAERYLSVRPDDADVLFTLGAVQRKAGRTQAAVAAYERSAELDRRGAAPRNNLAILLAETGDLSGALHWAQAAYALAPLDPFVLDTLGWLYVQKGLVDRGIAMLERAHERASGHEEVRRHLALAYEKAGRDAEAQDLPGEATPPEVQEPDVATRFEEAKGWLE